MQQNFGALWFIDHVEITHKGYAYVVLVIIDAMSNLLIVQTQNDKKESSTIEALKLAFTTWNVRHGKHLCRRLLHDEFLEEMV